MGKLLFGDERETARDVCIPGGKYLYMTVAGNFQNQVEMVVFKMRFDRVHTGGEM